MPIKGRLCFRRFLESGLEFVSAGLFPEQRLVIEPIKGRVFNTVKGRARREANFSIPYHCGFSAENKNIMGMYKNLL